VRYDVVALAALVVCVLLGLVPASEAFSGFGHPAVITVAAVLVLSAGLQASGAIDALAHRALPREAGPVSGVAALTAVGALLSAFVNNVGAMAMLMPIALQLAAKNGLTPGRVLMPLSFGTILGGMTTLIGTPPNLIVSGFRAQAAGASFGMFDFSPVGVGIAVTGVAFVALVGWRLVPAREPKGASGFDTGTYLTEARVPEGSGAAGRSLRELESELDAADAQIIGLIRGNLRLTAPNPARLLRAGDVLVLESDPEALATVLSRLGLVLEESAEAVTGDTQHEASDAEPAAEGETSGGSSEPERGGAAKRVEEEIGLTELVVLPTSRLVERTASDARIRSAHGLNLVAISRQGRRSIRRLRSTPIRAGDVLLMQGSSDAIASFASEAGCLPLAQRAIRIPDTSKALTASAVMLVAIAGAAFGLMPAAIAFVAGVVAFMLLRVLPARSMYDAIEWPVIVLLAALFPVAGAMESTGAADLIASSLLDLTAHGRPVVALVIILVVTMSLSDFMNNAATAAVMCPIAISTSSQLGVAADPFMMAVAVGASCAFLTPIGHQNNTLILGPGGFRFGDYWRLGLPMEILVVVVGTPLLLAFWPL
jgi:di/tricarboxylate transporter